MDKSAKRIAIVGAGIAGVTVAWQLARLGNVEATLFEAGPRLGGTVETIRRDGFVLECGPDGWVTEKPWARMLAEELGLANELIPSNDATRKTYILSVNELVSMPDAMRMMVPTDLAALDASPLFSAEAKRAYADEPCRAAELRAAAPNHDESIADFVLRHFGPEVLSKIAAPLLSGVFGGDVAKLSVRAVMPAFLQMERDHGSLITALQARRAAAAGKPLTPVFTTLKSGTATLIDRMAAAIPAAWIHRNTPVLTVHHEHGAWLVSTATTQQTFDHVILATPAHVASGLLRPLDPRMAELTTMDASSAVLAALAFNEAFDLPQGFGFLVPNGEPSQLLAGTFVDQKFSHRAPPGKRLLRAFFGGDAAGRIATLDDAEIAALALRELEGVIGRKLPAPAFSVVRRWPRSLPQYAVGHLERMAELDASLKAHPNLSLLGNAYRGVGLPDLIRDAREAAVALSA